MASLQTIYCLAVASCLVVTASSLRDLERHCAGKTASRNTTRFSSMLQSGAAKHRTTLKREQADCEPFKFNSQSLGVKACKYDLTLNSEGRTDFGNIRGCDDHTMFYSAKQVQLNKLPFGYTFRCDHADHLHFGLRSLNNRDWNQLTWRNGIECRNGSIGAECLPNSGVMGWKYNIECNLNGEVVGWDGFPGGTEVQIIGSTSKVVTLWVTEDRHVQLYEADTKRLLIRGNIQLEESEFPLDMVLSPRCPSGSQVTGSCPNSYIRDLGYAHCGRTPELTAVPTPSPPSSTHCEKDTRATCHFGVCFQNARGRTFCSDATGTCHCSEQTECVVNRSVPMGGTWAVCRMQDQVSDTRGEESTVRWALVLVQDIIASYAQILGRAFRR